MKAFIFDLDGVISDTQNLQAENEEKLLKKYGINLSSNEITKKYAGVSDNEFFQKVFSDFGKDVDLDKIIKEKWNMIFKAGQGHIKEIKGAAGLVKKLYDKGHKLAVASASIKPYIELVLKELKLTDYFQVKVSGTEVISGKPALDIFILAAKRLGAEPKDCVVIEDGINGMKAAKNAGMKCIGLVDDKNSKYPADTLVEQLSEIKIDKLSFY